MALSDPEEVKKAGNRFFNQSKSELALRMYTRCVGTLVEEALSALSALSFVRDPVALSSPPCLLCVTLWLCPVCPLFCA